MKMEEEFVNIICEDFKKKGFLTLKHVRIPPREIDIIAFEPTTLVTISIEVKLRDWKKVVSQSIINEKYSHFNYIAVPSNISEKIPESLIKNAGLGMIIWNQIGNSTDLQVKHQPKKSRRINRVFKRRIYKLFHNEFTFAI